MIILALHFGHDAAVAVLNGSQILSYVLRERHTRKKHALGLDLRVVDRAVEAAGIPIDQFDCAAVTSTQGVELITDNPDELYLDFGDSSDRGVPSSLRQELRVRGESIDGRLGGGLLESLYGERQQGTWLREAWDAMFPEYRERKQGDFRPVGCLDSFVTRPEWDAGKTMDQLSSTSVELDECLRFGFHYPATICARGHRLPAYYIHHHMAHAASSYYWSGFRDAAIFTHDGFADGRSYHGGMYYFGREHKIYPLCPHHLDIGGLYDRVGIALGLGFIGQAGKLMGLAAYGAARFYHEKFLGNHYDHGQRFKNDLASAWMYHCGSRGRRGDYDMSDYANPAHATAPINADIAASTQRLFEEIRMQSISVLRKITNQSGLATDNLCLSGGTALNCPSNSKIASSGTFANVSIEPNCDDGGLAIGAARFVYHNLFDNGLPPPRRFPPPFLGIKYSDGEILRALRSASDHFVFQECAAIAESAARDLERNLVVAWFQAGSETGPRALGHRSILADARQRDNWQRVNRIKGREHWRPLAPVVLASEAGRWFADVPLPSPYMLFNAKVRSDKIPAVTHVDGTSRIQTIDESCGALFRVLVTFFAMTGVPVLLNTSFNGRGEPIVETPADALRCARETNVDVLYLERFRITRKETRA